MRDGPAAGLALIDAVLTRGDLADYRLAHAARANLCRRLGEKRRSPGVLPAGPHLVQQEPERRFRERRLVRAAKT